jgi:hypothetical protein
LHSNASLLGHLAGQRKPIAPRLHEKTARTGLIGAQEESRKHEAAADIGK